MYDNISYWQERGKHYYDNFKYNKQFAEQEYELINFIEDNRIPHKSVLEIGCGFGRISRLITDNFDTSIYDAMDISQDQINKAISLTKENRINYRCMNISDLDYYTKYDLILAVEVLMHIPPLAIHDIIRKLVNKSTHFIHIDYYEQRPIHLAEHNFNHNYPEIYRELHKYVTSKRIKNQVLFST